MTKEKVKRKNDTARVIAVRGYRPDLIGKVLCKLKNTGNGYIAKFTGFGSCMQDHYVCLDYHQAVVLYEALGAFKEELEA